MHINGGAFGVDFFGFVVAYFLTKYSLVGRHLLVFLICSHSIAKAFGAHLSCRAHKTLGLLNQECLDILLYLLDHFLSQGDVFEAKQIVAAHCVIFGDFGMVWVFGGALYQLLPFLNSVIYRLTDHVACVSGFLFTVWAKTPKDLGVTVIVGV